MSIEIEVVNSKKDLKKFVKFPFSIYKNHPMWVPPMIKEEIDIFDPHKNPAYENAESKLFLAYKDGKPAGRIAAILSHVANQKYAAKNLRFGWFETIDDYQVATALFQAVEQWGKEKGLETMTGPHGFTDLDPEGMLIEGFDQLPTIAVYYNHPYYPEYLDKFGFQKEVDWLELQAVPPYETGIPPKLLRLADRIKERSSIRILKFNNKRDVRRVVDDVFYLIDETFAELYGTVPISEKQIKYYVKKYFPFIDKDLLQVAVNEKDESIGFMLAVPSLSRALQKAGGRMFPFGWFHILKAIKGKNEILDFYLAGIKNQYRGQGIDLLMVIEVVKAAMKKGYKIAESNPELETNTKVQAQWKYFNPRHHKRRRLYKKSILT